MAIISVGYEFDVPITTIIEYAKTKKPDIDFSKHKIESHVRSGIWYDKECPHQKSDSIKSQIEMKNWYLKRKDKEIIGHIRNIYITHFVIVLEMSCMNDYFFCVIANTGTSTTMHKVNALRGNYGEAIRIDDIKVKTFVYCHEK
jgi:hypothetical protein